MQLHIDIPADLYAYIQAQVQGGTWLCGPPPTVEEYIIKTLHDGMVRQVIP